MKRLFFLLPVLLCLFLARPALADDPIVGEIKMYAGSTAPDGWVFCRGQLLDVGDYSALYSILGCGFGCQGSPATYFNAPDLRQRFPVGVDPDHICASDDCYSMGYMWGEAEHTLTVAEMPRHRHRVGCRSNRFAVGVLTDAGQDYDGWCSWTDYAGDSLPHNNLPPYLALNFIIYTGVYANPTPTPTATHTPTSTPTITHTPTPTGTPSHTTNLPYISAYTHTLTSDHELVMPVYIDYGQIIIGGIGLLIIALFSLTMLTKTVR